MPIYEYDCEDCGARFEKLLFFSPHPASVSCPKCSSGRVNKRLSVISGYAGSSADSAASAADCMTGT